jgi:ParB/RepB/Spo0J family partition protein
MTTHPPDVKPVVPTGSLRRLSIEEIKPSRNNPRGLFDEEPLRDLRENIRQHGVLVPITVFPVRGQAKFEILDGERRYRCCLDLSKEGLIIRIPANVVEPPDKIAGLLYMFSIHNFREAWELMPTALSLSLVIDALGEQDDKKLARLTGLSEPQIERCKILLKFPKRFQQLSLDPDPKTRIPSNFWIEAYPVLDLVEQVLPDLNRELSRDGVTDKLVEKYRAKKIKSVIHFRRIVEAYEVADSGDVRKAVRDRLRQYFADVQLETRRAFDEFVVDSRRIQTAVQACEDFIARLARSKLEYALDRDDLIRALTRVKRYLETLLEKLAGQDAPGSEP